MRRIERIRTEVYNSNGTRDVICDMSVSTAAELPAMNEQQGSIIYKPDCDARIIRTGQWVTLDDDGKWYADGEEVDTDAVDSLSLNNAPLSLGKIKPSVIVPESFEPDELENGEPEGGEEDAELL